MSTRMQPRRGDIFMADLARDPLTRQSGKRPVVVVQNDMGNANSGSVIAVIVTSSHKKQLPTHVTLYPRYGLRRQSTALCEHIITIEKSCLLNYMGTTVNTEAEKQLDDALKISLSLRK